MGCKILPQINLKITRRSGACLMRFNSPITRHRAFKVARSSDSLALLIHKSRSFFFLGGSKNEKSNHGYGVACFDGVQYDPSLCVKHFPGGGARHLGRKMQDSVQQDDLSNFRRKVPNKLRLVGWQGKREGGFGSWIKSEQCHND